MKEVIKMKERDSEKREEKRPNRQHKAERVWSNRDKCSPRNSQFPPVWLDVSLPRGRRGDPVYSQSITAGSPPYKHTHSDAASVQITAPCLNPSQGCTWEISVPLAGSQRTENPRVRVCLPRRALNNKLRLFVREKRGRDHISSFRNIWTENKAMKRRV